MFVCFTRKIKKSNSLPDREILQLTMPACYKKNLNFDSNITVIINCFEVFIENPSDMCTSAEAWSNYKHHKTAKILIGISP